VGGQRGPIAIFSFNSVDPGRKNKAHNLDDFTPIFPATVGNSVGNDFICKRKGPLRGLNLLIFFGGRWATRTPDLWFRRPTLYPPELIARAQKFYQIPGPCQEKATCRGKAAVRELFPLFPMAVPRSGARNALTAAGEPAPNARISGASRIPQGHNGLNAAGLL
jgi:hypothetical protein